MSQHWIGANTGETLLLECLALYSEDPCGELAKLLASLKRVSLPFCLSSQIRKVEYPGYPTFECGMPPSFYYFVPDSGWGSQRNPPTDPMHPNAVYCTDGFGLNFGCPLRLKSALEILSTLPSVTTSECRRELSLPTKHLDTVEEILWSDIWSNTAKIERAENSLHKTHDWKVMFSDNLIIRQECKLRKALWPRLTDGPSFQPFSGFLLGKASTQLPNPPEQHSVNVVSVTGLAEVDDDLRRLISLELENHSNVEAVLYRAYAGGITVFSLSEQIAFEICSRIKVEPSPQFQPFYFIPFNRAERQRAQTAQKAAPNPKLEQPNKNLFSRSVPSLPPKQQFLTPCLPYRKKLIDRAGDGEPRFEVVVPYLKK